MGSEDSESPSFVLVAGGGLLIILVPVRTYPPVAGIRIKG